jgi:hypothetical protein
MTKTFSADGLLIAKYGYPIAVMFEKVWFLMHKSERAPDFTTVDEKGVVWKYCTYLDLGEQFETITPDGTIENVIGKERSIRRAVDDLVTAKLFIRKRSQVGFWLAINFEALQKIVGYDSRYGLYPPEENPASATECPDLDKDKITPIAECPDLDKQPPETPQSVQVRTDTLSTDGQTECPNLDTPYIYESDSLRDSLKEDSKETDSEDSKTTLPNGNGAKAPAQAPIFDDLLDAAPPKEVLPATTPFAAISRITHHGLKITDEDRTAILEAIGKLQNLETAQKEKLILDPDLIEDYAVWRMLLFWRGRDGFPNIWIFENEFRYEFVLNWYNSATNRKQINWIKDKFPDWRTRLFEGDYAEFREEVQAWIAGLRQKKQGTKPQQDFREQPYGATPAVKVTDEELDNILGGPS